MSAFPNEVFSRRRERIFDKMGTAVVVLPAAAERVRNNDAHFPFRQDSDFYYVTGYPEPNALAVLAGNRDRRFVLFTLPRDPRQEVWTGKRYGPEGARELFGADEAFPVDDLDRRMADLLSDVRRVYFAFGKDSGWDKRMMDWINQVRARGRRGAVSAPTELVDLSGLVHEMRLVKEPVEIEVMRRAARISAEAHLLAMERCRPGLGERDLQNELEHYCRCRGSRAMAYETIVAGGAHACILHYVENQGRLNEGDLVLIDAGCELDNYASDITRTFPVSGRFDPAQRRIYEIVLKAQLAGIDRARKGETIRTVHQVVLEVLAEELVRIGLLQGDPERHVWTCLQTLDEPSKEARAGRAEGEETGLHRLYMHSTSHWLGLDVHDAGGYRDGGEWRRLEPGMILTVEPGLYIPRGTDWVPDEYRGMGIRIEDSVLITEDGREVLTEGCPKAVDEVEAACAGRTS